MRPVILAAAGAAVFVSALWTWLWLERDRQHEADERLLSGRMANLNAQLDQQSTSMRDLLGEYGRAQDTRVNLETQLALARAELSHARNELETFAGGNWENRLHDEQRRGEVLDAQVGSLEQRLEESFRTNTELRGQIEASADLVRKLQSQVDNSTGEIDKLKRQLMYFTNQRQAPAESGNEGYRLARLESLQSTMSRRSSADRREILLSVIPTVPEGITASEFAALARGMDSADILALIQTMHGHLRKPLEATDTETVLGLLTAADAAAASKLLQITDAP